MTTPVCRRLAAPGIRRARLAICAGLFLAAGVPASPIKVAEPAQILACAVTEGNSVRYRYTLTNRDDLPIAGLILGYDNTQGAGYPSNGVLQLHGHPLGLDVEAGSFPESSFSGPPGWHAQWYADGEPDPFGIEISSWDGSNQQTGAAIPPGGLIRFSILVEHADPDYQSGRILVRPEVSRAALHPIPYSVAISVDASACHGP